MSATMFKMDRTCPALNMRQGQRGRPAFVAELAPILPGLVGGMASSLCFYPLEVAETLIQGASISSRRAEIRPAPERTQPEGGLLGFAHLDCIEVLRKANADGYLFRGFDSAFWSAVFGYTAFFSLLETGFGGDGVAGVLTRTISAAVLAYLVNSPFQLLKTATILADDPVPTSQLVSEVTDDGKKLSNLWYGSLANSLGVIFVSVQWGSFQFLHSASPETNAVILGTLASALAVVATYPFSVLRTAIMANPPGSKEEESCILSVAKQLINDGGLYNGVVTSVVRTVIPAAVLFGVKNMLTV